MEMTSDDPLSEHTEMGILGGALFVLLLVLALALPAQAQVTQNCSGRGDCEYYDDSINNTATGGSATTGAITNTNTVTGGSATVGNLTTGASNATVGNLTTGASSATVGNVTGGTSSAVTGASTASATAGDSSSSVGDIDNSSNADATGGQGGNGGNVEFNYPDQPVSSPAAAMGGVCTTGASVSTKDIGISIGTSDPLCRQIELIKLALLLKKPADEVTALYDDAVAMEKRGNWFARWKWTGWARGIPIIGRFL